MPSEISISFSDFTTNEISALKVFASVKLTGFSIAGYNVRDKPVNTLEFGTSPVIGIVPNIACMWQPNLSVAVGTVAEIIEAPNHVIIRGGRNFRRYITPYAQSNVNMHGPSGGVSTVRQIVKMPWLDPETISNANFGKFVIGADTFNLASNEKDTKVVYQLVKTFYVKGKHFNLGLYT